MVEFGLFVPPKTSKVELDYNYLKRSTGKEYTYASRGRHAIYHILKNAGGGTVILPAYACESISIAIKEAGLHCEYCDIDADDLNISYEDFVRLQTKTMASFVLVPSLYGNPADLVRIEKYCFDHNIFMIDDSAQSFGATLDGRYLSSFGSAGLMAFSPGKSTPGAMGALYWSENHTQSENKHHALIHKLIYSDYILNRRDVYKNSVSQSRKRIAHFFANYGERLIDIRNDRMAPFESQYIGGVIYDVINGRLSFRNKYHKMFVDRFSENKWFRIIKCKRGEPINHKIVLVLKDTDMRNNFKEYLAHCGISTCGGYPINGNTEELSIAAGIVGRVLELPIEDSDNKMNYLFECVDKFFIK